jgi:hypothetical protein
MFSEWLIVSESSSGIQRLTEPSRKGFWNPLDMHGALRPLFASGQVGYLPPLFRLGASIGTYALWPTDQFRAADDPRGSSRFRSSQSTRNPTRSAFPGWLSGSGPRDDSIASLGAANPREPQEVQLEAKTGFPSCVRIERLRPTLTALITCSGSAAQPILYPDKWWRSGVCAKWRRAPSG